MQLSFHLFKTIGGINGIAQTNKIWTGVRGEVGTDKKTYVVLSILGILWIVELCKIVCWWLVFILPGFQASRGYFDLCTVVLCYIVL